MDSAVNTKLDTKFENIPKQDLNLISTEETVPSESCVLVSSDPVISETISSDQAFSDPISSDPNQLIAPSDQVLN